MADRLSTPLELPELSSSPSNPSSGYQKIYAKSDGKLYVRTSAGVESELTPKFDTLYQTIELGVSSTSVISAGAKGRKVIKTSGTIVGWKLVTDTNATVTLDVWKSNASIPTNANSITASAKPSISAAQFSSSSVLTGWTTSVGENDILILEVESNDNATYILLVLEIQI